MLSCSFWISVALIAQSGYRTANMEETEPVAALPEVRIMTPLDGATLVSGISLAGTSQGATNIRVALDDQSWQEIAAGELWETNFALDRFEPGSHSIRVEARNSQGKASDEVRIVVAVPQPGVHPITYGSSFDGATLSGQLYLPSSYESNNAPRPLFVFLHGGGGSGRFSPYLREQIDRLGWIGLAPDGRRWGLYDKGCPWRHSPAYFDSPNPDVGPGEQDVLDALTWAEMNLPVDSDRIYLSGFSLGGRGAYSIGLKNPDRFAALGPLGAPTDMFEVWKTRPDRGGCKRGMYGGAPDTSVLVDTFYSITSARYLLENAYNLPVYHGHGLQDRVVPNAKERQGYLHGWHITTDNSLSTPTFSELHARHPQGYIWASMFTVNGHRMDPLWLRGTTAQADGFIQGYASESETWIGMFDFMKRFRRNSSPDQLVYKSYTDLHRQAYWVTIDIEFPWQNRPGAVRATRDREQNRVEIEVAGVTSVRVHLDLAGLRLEGSRPLAVKLVPLRERTFDPALTDMDSNPPLLCILQGGFANPNQWSVRRDGQLLDDEAVRFGFEEVLLGPWKLPTEILIAGKE